MKMFRILLAMAMLMLGAQTIAAAAPALYPVDGVQIVTFDDYDDDEDFDEDLDDDEDFDDEDVDDEDFNDDDDDDDDEY